VLAATAHNMHARPLLGPQLSNRLINCTISNERPPGHRARRSKLACVCSMVGQIGEG
jgi:hypothetical protein